MKSIFDFLTVQKTIADCCGFVAHNLDQIEDVEYEELTPDPDDGHTPVAALVSVKHNNTIIYELH